MTENLPMEHWKERLDVHQELLSALGNRERTRDIPIDKLALEVCILGSVHSDYALEHNNISLELTVWDSLALREVLGVPLQCLDGEIAAVSLPIIRSAVKKIDKVMAGESVSLEMIGIYEALTQMLAWCKLYPTGIFGVA